MISDALAALQRWYLDQCDGDWEHGAGVSITTLDNPGWRHRVDLASTPVANRPFERVELHRSERDWVVAWRDDHGFEAACGPLNLEEAVELFIAWVG